MEDAEDTINAAKSPTTAQMNYMKPASAERGELLANNSNSFGTRPLYQRAGAERGGFMYR